MPQKTQSKSIPSDQVSRRKQKTKPKKGEPIEVPVPKRKTIDSLLKKAAQPLRKK